MLDLVVPDLLLPPDAPAPLRALRLPRLERWIARGQTERIALEGGMAWLAARHEMTPPPPIAAVTLAADAAIRAGAWLRADPVHMALATDAVVLHDASVLDLHRDEAAALTATLREHFAAESLEIVAPHPSRWYVKVPAGELPSTTPLEGVRGRNVFGLLPRSTGRINWASALTESQMLFSSHPVNAEREASGRPAVNSVWFWGEGLAPAAVPQVYALVYADDAFARGLGVLSGARIAETPASADNVDMVTEGESVLVVLDAASAPLRRGDVEAWTAAAHQLDEAWFAHLPRLVERFDGVRVVLTAGHETRVATIDASSRWRWFRPRAPINAHA